MSLTQHPKYENVWIARIYPDGRRKDPKTGKASNRRETLLFEGSRADAVSWYAALCRSKAAPKVTPIAPTLKQAWPQFTVYYENHLAKSTYRDYLCTWQLHLEPFFGDFRPKQITPGIIESYKKKRIKDVSQRGTPTKPKTVNKELSFLSAQLSWMASPEVNLALPVGFPIKGFPSSKTEAPEPIIPSRESIIKFLRGADRQTFRPLFAIFYYTGMRRTEVLTLRDDQINTDFWTITQKVKGGKFRVYPVHTKIRVYLRNRKGTAWATKNLEEKSLKTWKKNRWIFPNPETGEPWKELKPAIRRASKKAGLDQHIYLHLFRHTFGVHSIMSGIELRTLQHLMGHSSSQVTERYTKLAAQHLGVAIQQFGRGALREQHAKKSAGKRDDKK